MPRLPRVVGGCERSEAMTDRCPAYWRLYVALQKVIDNVPQPFTHSDTIAEPYNALNKHVRECPTCAAWWSEWKSTNGCTLPTCNKKAG